MFVLRSAFWLVIGFLLVAPHGTDFGATATALKDQAINAGVKAGEQLIVSQIVSSSRLPDLLLSSSTSTADLPMQEWPAELAVFPRPRPASLG
jgi:hypothetical protein